MRKHWTFEEIIDILCADPDDRSQAEHAGGGDNAPSENDCADANE